MMLAASFLDVLLDTEVGCVLYSTKIEDWVWENLHFLLPGGSIDFLFPYFDLLGIGGGKLGSRPLANFPYFPYRSLDSHSHAEQEGM